MDKFSCKKAAMFGLDARIALTIFAALSVISGATLFSAIKYAKATALLTNMDELIKSLETYYIDVGSLPGKFSDISTTDEFYILSSVDLITKPAGVTNWKGPYTSYPKEPSSTVSLDHPLYSHQNLLTLIDTDNAWGDAIAWWDGGECTSGKKCYIWAEIVGVPDTTLALSVDDIVDSGDGAGAGKFRWYEQIGSPKTYRYYLKGFPIKNPHD